MQTLSWSTIVALCVCACGGEPTESPDASSVQHDASSSADAASVADAEPFSCSADSYEEDDDKDGSRVPDFESVDLVNYPDNTLCENDEDWFYVYLFTNETIEIAATFDQSAANRDLDVLIYYDDGAGPTLLTPCTEQAPAGCDPNQGQSRTSNEVFSYTAENPGDHYFVVRGWMGSENSYQMCLALFGASCDSPGT